MSGRQAVEHVAALVIVDDIKAVTGTCRCPPHVEPEVTREQARCVEAECAVLY